MYLWLRGAISKAFDELARSDRGTAPFVGDLEDLEQEAEGALVGREARERLHGRLLDPAVGVHGREPAEVACRALVADDEVPLRKLLQRLLTRRGFAVDTAEDGLQAAGMLEQTRYDVILCDVQMPRMTGTQLFESIRRRQPHLAAAFVLISGDILNGPLQTFVETHQIPLLSKPFGAKTLDVALDQVLAHRVQARDVAEARAS